MGKDLDASSSSKRLQALAEQFRNCHATCSDQFSSKIKQSVQTDPQVPRPFPSVSLWQQPPHQTVATAQSATLPSYADFVVIGSGITGCSVAKALLEHHKFSSASNRPRVCLLEARTLVSGATGRNGGNLVSACGHTYGDLKRQYGEANAKQIVRFSIQNIDFIFKMVQEMDPALQAASQIRNVTKLMVAGDEQTWQHARQSLEEFQAAIPEHRGYHRLVDKDEVAREWNVKNSYGAIAHVSGAVWPYRLLTEILERLLRQHSDVFTIEANTPVTAVELIKEDTGSGETRYIVRTPRGPIEAKQVIYCTNAYTSHLIPKLRGKLYPYRATMSVHRSGSQLENWGSERSWSLLNRSSLDPQNGIYNTGLTYLQQNAQTGDLWLGIESANIFKDLTSDDTHVSTESKETLGSFLPTFFEKGWEKGEDVHLKGIWTGIQGHTADGLPLVGRLPPSVTGRAVNSGEWIAAGFNGYGMDKCWLTGVALVDMILGEGVRDWFPRCYLIDDERFQKKLSTKRIVDKFSSIVSTGA